ncbi:MAG TPA: Glu-tRNA(Gln) amidotransferase subunit GatD [Candidatus Nanoarchaeia archaeon]|nr:Glu-tRNA(Gln) amidotransferase subunit GatD [Candidatus Nanoarchaeia archaeon]
MKEEFSAENVEIKTKDKEFIGILLPSSKKDTVFLKLDSGYNIGIEKKNIKSMKRIKKVESEKKVLGKLEVNKNLPTIAILHTGGTVASEVDYKTGAVSPRFTPEEIIAKFPELKNMANIRSKLIANMFSEDIRFSHYNKIAKEIENEVKAGVEGIIISHGTDTLHYTAAALSFMLQDLGIPVILVGAQRSSDRGSSDAFLNLVSAALFITKSDFAGVGICMHSSMDDNNCVILPGLKSRKMHSSRRDAFKAINSNPIARVNYKKDLIEFLTHDHKKSSKDLKLKVRLFNEKLKIGIVKAHPNMYASELKSYSSFNGLILEGTGLGHLPVNKLDKETTEHDKILKEISKLAKKMPVVMATQTIFGRVNMNVYSTGRKLLEAGVLGNYSDMTTETAFIKLAYLLSNYKKDEIKRLMNENLHGEISKRIIGEEEFL